MDNNLWLDDLVKCAVQFDRLGFEWERSAVSYAVEYGSNLQKENERLRAELAERDTDWILAIGHALGLDSGYEVPIVPEVQAFKNLFAEIQKQAGIAAQED